MEWSSMTLLLAADGRVGPRAGWLGRAPCPETKRADGKNHTRLAPVSRRAVAKTDADGLLLRFRTS